MDDQRSDAELEHYLQQVIIGPFESTDIRVVAYDPAWPRRFTREAAEIHAALGGRERLIEHIGSTAVPRLAAKPIIDILLVVENAADESSYLPALEGAGYVLRVREPDFYEHRMLRTPAKDVHVHVFSPDSPEIERYLMLRDRLHRDLADRELYAQTKRPLAAQSWPSMQHYAEAKTEVIEAILARAATAQRLDQGDEPREPWTSLDSFQGRLRALGQPPSPSPSTPTPTPSRRCRGGGGADRRAGVRGEAGEDAAKEHGAAHDRERQPLLLADGKDRPSAAATPRPAAQALRTRRARHIPLGGVSVAAPAHVSKQVAAAREGLPAGGAAKCDRAAKPCLTAVVVKQTHMVVEVPLRLQDRAADLAVEGLRGGKCGHVA